jgi:hypothetical protein
VVAKKNGTPVSMDGAAFRSREEFTTVVIGVSCLGVQDAELFDAQRLFACVLGSEPGKERVIPLPRGPLVHIIGQVSAHQLP